MATSQFQTVPTNSTFVALGNGIAAYDSTDTTTPTAQTRTPSYIITPQPGTISCPDVGGGAVMGLVNDGAPTYPAHVAAPTAFGSGLGTISTQWNQDTYRHTVVAGDYSVFSGSYTVGVTDQFTQYQWQLGDEPIQTLASGASFDVSKSATKYSRIQVRSVGSDGRLSPWCQIQHYPIAILTVTADDESATLDASASYDVPTEIALYELKFTAEGYVVNYAAYSSVTQISHEDLAALFLAQGLTLTDETFISVTLRVTDGEGLSRTASGSYIYYVPTDTRVGLLADFHGFILHALKSGTSLSIQRYDGTSWTTTATLANLAQATLFASTQSADYFLLAKSASAWQLYKSADTGVTWTLMSAPFDASTYKGATACQTFEGWFIAAAIAKTGGATVVRISGDGGATWATVPATGVGSGYKTLTLAPATDGSARVFLQTDSAFKVTTDTGTTWVNP